MVTYALFLDDFLLQLGVFALLMTLLRLTRSGDMQYWRAVESSKGARKRTSNRLLQRHPRRLELLIGLLRDVCHLRCRARHIRCELQRYREPGQQESGNKYERSR